MMAMRALAAALLGLLCLSADAAAPPLRVAVDSSTAMPMTRIVRGEVTAGIQRDLALALAQQLGAPARIAPMPRKRIAMALEQGEADVACHFLPAWLPGNFDWTMPFMPNAILIVTGVQSQAPANLDALRGAPIGTVLGFVYPEVQHALGQGFVRDDAADALLNLTKFAAGRTRHALTGEVFFSYQQRLHPNLLQVHRPILVSRFEARCAVSQRGNYPAMRIDQAIRALQKGKQIEAMYAKYK